MIYVISVYVLLSEIKVRQAMLGFIYKASCKVSRYCFPQNGFYMIVCMVVAGVCGTDYTSLCQHFVDSNRMSKHHRITGDRNLPIIIDRFLFVFVSPPHAHPSRHALVRLFIDFSSPSS